MFHAEHYLTPLCDQRPFQTNSAELSMTAGNYTPVD